MDRELRTGTLQSIPAKRELNNVPPSFLTEILADIVAGNVHTAKQVAEMLRCSDEKARREIKKEPGHYRVGSDYRIPYCVFRNMVQQLLH